MGSDFGDLGGRTPVQAHMHLITKPVKPKRSPVINIRLADTKYSSWKQFLDAAYWTVMDRGTMGGLHRGTPERADIRLRIDSDHLIDLVNGKASMLRSYVTGKVRIEASVTDLMRLRRMA